MRESLYSPIKSFLTRRALLRTMSWGWGTLALPHVLRMRAAAGATSAREPTSLILLWQDGGPSHFETFDPKPDAPSEFRGELSSIATSLPGVRFCEILPQLAGMAHKFSVIRSLHQPSSNHVSATRLFISGHPTTLETGSPTHPDLGAIIHRVRGSRLSRVPHYVALKDAYATGLHRGGTAYLGSSAGPFVAEPDPLGVEYRVNNLQRDDRLSEERFQSRLSLRDSLNRFPDTVDSFGKMAGLDYFHDRAAEMLRAADAQRAFDLAQEPPAVRDRYGRHRTGNRRCWRDGWSRRELTLWRCGSPRTLAATTTEGAQGGTIMRKSATFLRRCADVVPDLTRL